MMVEWIDRKVSIEFMVAVDYDIVEETLLRTSEFGLMTLDAEGDRYFYPWHVIASIKLVSES